jgi:hypothetical protein
MSPDGTRPVRAVFGLPLYNGAAHLAEALESLLSQTASDFAIVLADDRSTDETPEIAARYAALDSRISYASNDERLGLARNWKNVFERCVEAFPDAEFFAWASDHDVWHPRWLERLTAALDESPRATLAFPDVALLRPGAELRLLSTTRDTSDVVGTFPLVNRVIRGGLSRGNMVYGLFRADAVRSAGGFRQVLVPDKLLVAEVALQGPTVRVPELLWYRRPTASFEVARQRRALFPDGRPVVARLPWPFAHGAWIAWDVARGRLSPAVAPRRAAPVAGIYVGLNLLAIAEKRLRRARKSSQGAARSARAGALGRARGAKRRVVRHAQRLRLRAATAGEAARR